MIRRPSIVRIVIILSVTVMSYLLSCRKLDQGVRSDATGLHRLHIPPIPHDYLVAQVEAGDRSTIEMTYATDTKTGLRDWRVQVASSKKYPFPDVLELYGRQIADSMFDSSASPTQLPHRFVIVIETVDDGFSVGLKEVSLTADGVLHLQVGMLSRGSSSTAELPLSRRDTSGRQGLRGPAVR